MKRTIALGLALPALAACGSVKQDFDKLCVIAGAVATDPDPVRRSAAFAKQAATEISSSEVTKMYAAFAVASPDVHYKMVLSTARDAGLSDWRACLSLARWLDHLRFRQ